MRRATSRRARRALGTLLLYAAAAVVLGGVVPRLEAHSFPGLTAGISATSAIALLSAIATGARAFAWRASAGPRSTIARAARPSP